jgi:hypothetical protein
MKKVNGGTTRDFQGRISAHGDQVEIVVKEKISVERSPNRRSTAMGKIYTGMLKTTWVHAGEQHQEPRGPEFSTETS